MLEITWYLGRNWHSRGKCRRCSGTCLLHPVHEAFLAVKVHRDDVLGLNRLKRRGVTGRRHAGVQLQTTYLTVFRKQKKRNVGCTHETPTRITRNVRLRPTYSITFYYSTRSCSIADDISNIQAIAFLSYCTQNNTRRYLMAQIMHIFGIIHCTLYLDFGKFQHVYTSCIHWKIKTSDDVARPKRYDLWLAVCKTAT